MKKISLLLCNLAIAVWSFGQTTVTFKPNASIGEDAIIWQLNGNCIPSGYTQTPANVNFGSDPEVNFTEWTWSADGCGEGTMRELIRFTEISTIPANATILSASIVLNGPTPTVYWGNNYYPGTPLPNSNLGWAKRVLPGSSNAWDENTVTWNSQPGTDPVSANWATIPLTGARWGWTQNIDVTNMVQNIVNELPGDPNANNGFLLMLQNEAYYRQQGYASSDNADSTLWPELTITYTDCKAAFSYCVSSNNTYIYDFSAANPSMASYTWTVNGTPVGSSSTLNYNFGVSGSYEVCLKVTSNDGYSCDRCIRLCISDNDTISAMKIAEKDPIKSSPQITVIPVSKKTALKGDDPSFTINQDAVKISPNPSDKGWNVDFTLEQSDLISVTLFDYSGKEISKGYIKAVAGLNHYVVSTQNITSGIYFIELKGKMTNSRQKVVRK